MYMKKNVIKEKTYAFAIKVVRVCRDIQTNQKEYVLSRQLLKSGTASGALVREAEQAESRKDFIHKMAIALKEASETEYWLNILRDTDYINPDQFADLNNDCIEIIKILTSIVKTSPN